MLCPQFIIQFFMSLIIYYVSSVASQRGMGAPNRLSRYEETVKMGNHLWQ